MISLDRYNELFRAPGFGGSLLASIIGRLPIGLATLAILLFVQDRTGSFSLAGITTALYVIGLATVAPFLGRMVDRLGPVQVLAATAVLYPVFMCTLVYLVITGEVFPWVLVVALAGGAAFPPITACIRTLYPRLVKDVGLLQTAYSVDSILMETFFIVGPVLVALFVAAGAPHGAVLFAAACAAAGSLVFLRAPGVRNWTIHPVSERRALIGPLRHPPLLAVFAATVLYALAFGLYEVAVTAFATARGSPAAAGVFLALASIGSAAGALIYGSRDWRGSIPQQFLVAVALMAAGLLLLVPLQSLVLFALGNILAGIPMATVIAVQSLLISQLAPRAMLAESFTWGTTCLLGGVGAGIAAGGLLADATSPATVLAAAAGSAVLAGLVVWAALDPVTRES
jgi:MFS family permease